MTTDHDSPHPNVFTDTTCETYSVLAPCQAVVGKTVSMAHVMSLRMALIEATMAIMHAATMEILMIFAIVCALVLLQMS